MLCWQCYYCNYHICGFNKVAQVLQSSHQSEFVEPTQCTQSSQAGKEATENETTKHIGTLKKVEQALGNMFIEIVSYYVHTTWCNFVLIHVCNNYIGSKRKRCRQCSRCQAQDCGACKMCLDKPKFGGKGRLKQCCVKRRCIQMAKSLYYSARSML